jgi:iron complex transport system substrate-binding protein
MKLLKNSKIIIVILLLSIKIISGAEPKTIVSLAPSVTESLYLLGLEKQLIAVTSYCNYPKEARTKKIIGSMTNPNIEKIFSLSPDLIVTIKGINRYGSIKKLKSLGLKVAALDKSKNFEDICRNFIILGKISGRKKKAKKIVKKITREIETIKSKIKNSPPLKIFWEVGSRPLITAGKKSFVNDFIKYAGGINIFSDTAADYFRINQEEILKRNPEVIIMTTMGKPSNKEKKKWQKFKNISAVKNNRIYLINADKVCRPTPLSFLAGLKEIVKTIHPDEERK